MKLPKTIQLDDGRFGVKADCCGEGAKLLSTFSNRDRADKARLLHLDMFHDDANPGGIETFDSIEQMRRRDRKEQTR